MTPLNKQIKASYEQLIKEWGPPSSKRHKQAKALAKRALRRLCLPTPDDLAKQSKKLLRNAGLSPKQAKIIHAQFVDYATQQQKRRS